MKLPQEQTNKTPLLTEQIDPRYADLDSWSTARMIAAMYDGQVAAAAAVEPVLDALARAVDDAVPGLTRGGRIVYAGAGTSGRIGVQDGAELTPTFDWPADRVVFLMAGGPAALLRSAEAAEDSEDNGAHAVAAAKIGPDDVIIAIAASGATPYTVGALRAAGSAGAVTIAIANNPGAPLLELARHPILVETGSEIIAGSTRMKAGTAHKIVLNLFSTALMVKLGRIYRGMMVHMRATNAKLRRRAEAIVREIAGCTQTEAARYVDEACGDVKIAVLLAFGMNSPEAARLLELHEGNLRVAIGDRFPPPRAGEVPSGARRRGTSRSITPPSGPSGHLPHVGGGKENKR
ncbi:MAG TPA: N-acetylmuramic acid 6-phosphate etherase [Rhizomicrobium sp.]|nr:N-acetylmuramic acid 6-phosphate etherase [Rhizomicrobium sp.]